MEGVGSIEWSSPGVESERLSWQRGCSVLKLRRIGWSRRGTEKGKREHDGNKTRPDLEWTRPERQNNKGLSKAKGGSTVRAGEMKTGRGSGWAANDEWASRSGREGLERELGWVGLEI